MEGFTLLHLVTYSLLWGELAGPPGYLGCVGLYQEYIPFPDQVQSAVEIHSILEGLVLTHLPHNQFVVMKAQ